MMKLLVVLHISSLARLLIIATVLTLPKASFGNQEIGQRSIPSSASSCQPVTAVEVVKEEEENNHQGYEILNEKTIFSRWRSIISRVVKMPNGNVVDYDIVDQQGAGAVIIFAWNSSNKSAVIIREYNPGCHRILSGLAAGIVETDPDKHGADFDIAAKHELEEECHLAGGTWHKLIDDGVQIPMDKYSSTNIGAYLVIDPTKVDNPRPLDHEEDIEILEGVSIEIILRMIARGEMNLVGGWACLLAINKLRELGEIQ